MKHRLLNKVWLLVVVLLMASLVLMPACKGEETTKTLTTTKTMTTTTTSPPTTTTTPPTTTTPKPAIKNPDTFIMATIGDIDSLDPAYAYDTASGEAQQLIYETLIFYDGESTTEFVPMLATEWNVSADGLTYRFKIREGVKFHNGDDLTPEDVEYTFERGMVQDYGAGPQWMFFEPLLGGMSSRDVEPRIPLTDITNAVEVDGQWVQFNLAQPYEPFLQILCGSWGGIVDKDWCIANGDWDGTEASYEALNDPPSGGSPLQSIANGTGPFKLERWEPGVEFTAVINEDYWREPANFNRVIIKVVDEWTTRKLMLEAGDADYVYVPRAYISELEGVEGLTIYKDLPQITIDSFFFQFDISPESTFVGSGQLDGNGIPPDFFTDLDVRMGFALAFDWDTYIQDALLGEGIQADSPVIEGLSYYNPDLPKHSMDLDAAAEHLKAAWGGEVWEKGFNLTLCYNAGNLPRRTACQILAENLLSINDKFVVNVQAMQWPTLLRGMYSGLLPMFQIGWLPDFTDAHNFVVPFLHSQGTFSGWQHYNNPTADALIAQGIASTDPAERQSIYDQLGMIYYNDVPGILLAQPLGRRYMRDWVQGFYFNPALPSEMGYIYNLSKTYD